MRTVRRRLFGWSRSRLSSMASRSSRCALPRGSCPRGGSSARRLPLPSRRGCGDRRAGLARRERSLAAAEPGLKVGLPSLCLAPSLHCFAAKKEISSRFLFVWMC